MGVKFECSHTRNKRSSNKDSASATSRVRFARDFGASGDLTRRKLIPGLYDLTCVGCVPRKFEVLGVGRTAMTTEEFRARMRQGALDSGASTTLIKNSGRILKSAFSI